MEYNEQRILEILKSLLGYAYPIRDEYKFHCPFCHHRKPKLQLNILSQKWNCWVCSAKGRSLFSLARKLNAPKSTLDVLSVYSKNTNTSKHIHVDEDPIILLPREYISLETPSNDIDYNMAFNYIKKRNISYEDIVKYNIGFCPIGIYKGRIIIPSYDSSGQLNYFIARSYYPYESFKYKNPPISKNVIVFDLQINWNEPITLCEGVFDAIAIKRNSIPLLGKNIPIKLYDKIIQEKVRKISIALDDDAKDDSLRIANRLMREGITVSIIKLSGKDPSEMGNEEYEQASNKSKDFGFSDLIREKLYG